MRSLFRNRPDYLVVGVIAVLLSVLIGRTLLYHQPTEDRRNFIPRTPQPIVIGEFTVPPLAGWRQLVTDDGIAHNVTLIKNERDGRLGIAVLHFESQDSTTPKTAQELQSASQRDIQSWTQKMNSFGTTVQSSPFQSTTLNGMTAVESSFTTRSSQGEVWHGKYTYFINNSNFYQMQSSISFSKGETGSPALQTELDDAVSTLSRSLTSTQ